LTLPPLGTTTESASVLSRTAFFEGLQFDGVTGESLDGSGSRLRRWDLLTAAQKLLPGHRVGVCNRAVCQHEQQVSVYRRRDGSGAYYAGLMQCGSVWACPVCSAKVTERRRVELRQALDNARNAGLSPLLLTLTVPHQVHQELSEVLGGLLSAYKALVSGRNALSKLEGYVGQVRSLEVTYGSNGWHPHLHVLLFVRSDLSSTWLEGHQKSILARWAHVVGAVGLGRVHHRFGVDLVGADRCADYVAKWGLAEEMTKTGQKVGRVSTSRTPFQLLEDSSSDWLSGVLFEHYVEAMHGRAQLYWSRGLRDLLDLGAERSDEELVEHEEQGDELYVSLTRAEWTAVLRRGARSALLELARAGDVLEGERFVSEQNDLFMIC
jgi:hypothetical protein